MERWKDIPGFEGLYQASDHGNIRTSEGKTTSNARFPHRIWKQRILKQKYQHRKNSASADAKVTLWKDGKEYTRLVSRLVAMTWCSGYADGLTVNHIDGNPMNNRADNLEWISLGENIRKGFAEKLYSTQKSVFLVNSAGDRMQFRSMSSASRYLGKNDGYISGLLAKNITQINDEYTIVTSF